MWLEIRPTTCTSSWMTMGSSSQIHEISFRRTLGSHIATYEELCTFLAEIEACLNFRLLFTLSDDHFNQTYLSPGHILIGEPLTLLTTMDLTDIKCNRFSRWQLLQQQLQQFWNQLSAEYFQGLQQRQRWQRYQPNFKPGNLVYVREDNSTPLQWPTGVNLDTHPGSDGNFRVVTIKTPKGVFKRPVTKICPLPP
jgi:hypothetical protein